MKPALRELNPWVAGGVGITVTVGTNTAAIQTAASGVNAKAYGGTSNK